MDNLACISFKHDVGWVSVTKTKDVSYHRHDRKTSSVICATIEPNFRVLALYPKYFLDILTKRLLKCVPEDFNFVRKRANFKEFAHLLHKFVLDIGYDIVFLAMLTDQYMQSVTVTYPTYKSCILTQRNNRIFLDS